MVFEIASAFIMMGSLGVAWGMKTYVCIRRPGTLRLIREEYASDFGYAHSDMSLSLAELVVDFPNTEAGGVV